jgi:uncharacterized CHY-type Zn-finger protein
MAIDNDKLASAIWSTVCKFENEDDLAHRRFFKEALVAEQYWFSRQHVFFDNDTLKFLQDAQDEEQLFTANVYTPNGESVIAAMSSTVPQVNFYPDDADSTDDVTTASAYQRIATLIIKHNRAHTIITRALYILYNQHFAAFWNYSRKSSKYGTYKKAYQKEVSFDREILVCPECEVELEENTSNCPYCNSDIEPQRKSVQETYYETVEEEHPKSRELIKVFGPLHVRIAPYVQDQEDSPYIILDFEAHPSLARRLFEKHKDKLTRPSTDIYSDYRRLGRASLYRGDYDHLDTWKCIWLYAWAYEYIDDEDVRDYLKQNYPDGLYVIYVNKVLVDIENQNPEEHWTFTHNPLSNYIHARPLGSSCISVQDATNELINLSMDTIKHGIPQTFAAADVLDLNAYSASDVSPGKVWPTKSVPPGRAIQDFIMTTRTATLSQEVKDVYGNLQQLSQLVTGAFPSIYGGILSGSRTASEYSQSRAQALQRLSTIWTMMKETWAEVIAKACRDYAKMLEYDEREVEKLGTSFINVWIRRTELSGRIGRVEPEADESLPVTWAQQRDVLLRLIEINSPAIAELFSMPENAYIIKNALGIRDLLIPFYQDKVKQRAEIQELIAGNDVQVDQMVDNHAAESAECRSFLISEEGRDLKNTNPEAYQRIYNHYLEHAKLLGGPNAGGNSGS